MLTKEEFETLDDLHNDIIQGLGSDLETGSHHFNNAASTEFAKKHPRLIEAITAMGAWIRKQEELL